MTALFGLSILARLPLAMLSIGLLVHTQAATGEYTAAGLVAGAFALAQGVGGPALGRAADRRGQFAVLAAAALLSATALIVTSVLPHDVPIVLRVALAAAAGAALPPVGACFGALLPSLAGDREGAREEMVVADDRGVGGREELVVAADRAPGAEARCREAWLRAVYAK